MSEGLSPSEGYVTAGLARSTDQRRLPLVVAVPASRLSQSCVNLMTSIDDVATATGPARALIPSRIFNALA